MVVGHASPSSPQTASKAARPEVTTAVSSDEVCFGDREKEEPPSPIEASPPRSFLEKMSKKKTPKAVKMPKPSKVPKPPKPPKPPKSLKLKDGGKKKGKKCRGAASPTIPNLDLLEAHTKEALTKIEPPKKGKVGGLAFPAHGWGPVGAAGGWACGVDWGRHVLVILETQGGVVGSASASSACRQLRRDLYDEGSSESVLEQGGITEGHPRGRVG